MRLLQSFKMAWHAVSANKLRAFLTMLGIMIGVVALVVLVSIADGATTSVTDEISGMGSSYLTVTISDDKENPLKLSEISGFAEPDEVDAAAPMARTSVTAKSGYTSESMTLIGTTGRYLDIQKMEIQYGRFIKNADVENGMYPSRTTELPESSSSELLLIIFVPFVSEEELSSVSTPITRKLLPLREIFSPSTSALPRSSTAVS